MALTVTSLYEYGPESTGDRWENLLTIDFDSSYPTGGEALSKADMGFGTAADPSFDVTVRPKGGYVFEYDYTNAKVIAYRQKDPAAAGGADIPLPEVGNTTDLSALTGVRVVARGRFRL